MVDARDIAVPPEAHRDYEYKKIVEEIKNLEWEKLSAKELQDLMYLSYVAAIEFAEAVRITLKLYPDNEKIKEMASGELNTNNLKVDEKIEYDKVGDHWEFLKHFIDEYGIKPSEEVRQHAERYLEACRNLSEHTRAMSIFSREQELHTIFEEIIKAKDWTAVGLKEYRYYLNTHIDLDTGEGGHGELTEEMPIDDSVKEFYEARLTLYRAIPALFKNEEN